jgi:CBS domain-containing protein
MTINPTAVIDVKIRDIMTKRVITVKSSRTVKNEVDKMVEKDIECLPVIRKGPPT